MDGAEEGRTFLKTFKTLRQTISCYKKLLDLETARRPPGPALRPGNPRSILLLTWYFPPILNSGVFRPAALTRYGSRRGWEITVLCGPMPGRPDPAGEHLRASIPDEVRVHEVGPRFARPSYRLFPEIGGGFPKIFATIEAGTCVAGGRAPAAVVATGPPFHNFVTAYALARRLGSRLVLDYRDEWTRCPFDFVQSFARDRAWEPRCLRAADLVTFTTESQLKHCLESFPGLDRRKFLVVPNGWEPSDFEPSQAERPRPRASDGVLTLSFVGMLNNHCLPGDFLRPLGELLSRRSDLIPGVRVRFVGGKAAAAMSQISRFPFPQCLDLLQYVPKREANRIMMESSGLLLFNGPSMSRYLPGKIFDYLAAGPPLLVTGEGGEIERLVTQLGAGKVVPAGDVDALERALDEIRTRPPSQWQTREAAEWLSEHTREKTSDRMLDAIERITTGRREPTAACSAISRSEVL